MERRHDIDWLRVIAIGLLLVYHVAIGFQPWGIMIGFITNEETWPSLWLPMSMLNVWRIPLLFFVSGIGVYFAMANRSWKQLIAERSLRILLPYLFGTVFIFPISSTILQHYYGWNLSYTANAGHLWFLGNIFVYVTLLAPVFYYMRSNRNRSAGKFFSNMLRTPLGLIPFVAMLIIEVVVIKPYPFEMYAMTWHGFALGFVSFFSGFCLVSAGQPFWNMVVRWRGMFFALGLGFYFTRTFVFNGAVPGAWLVCESCAWIFAVFALGYQYLNRPGKILSYLREAAYPVYILHMIFLFLGSALLFPLSLVVELKFIALLLFTVTCCLFTFELIKRVAVLRLLFGMKLKSERSDRMY